MLLTLGNNTIHTNNIILCEPINNTVIDNSKFIRLIYSDKNIIMNGIYIKISIHINNIENSYNKLRCYAEPEKNKEIYKIISSIENIILSKYISNKTSSYKLTECLSKGIIKIFSENFIKNQYNISNNNNYKTDRYNGDNSLSLTKNANDSSLYNIGLANLDLSISHLHN